jgi:translation initiation factor 2 beta subunit (eIF-2beta)/eIF-5
MQLASLNKELTKMNNENLELALKESENRKAEELNKLNAHFKVEIEKIQLEAKQKDTEIEEFLDQIKILEKDKDDYLKIIFQLRDAFSQCIEQFTHLNKGDGHFIFSNIEILKNLSNIETPK